VAIVNENADGGGVALAVAGREPRVVAAQVEDERKI